MSAPLAARIANQATDEFVADPTVAKELSVTLMTLWRYDRDPEMLAMGWPVRMKIRNRNFRSRKQLEAYKAAMLKKAMANRRREVA